MTTSTLITTARTLLSELQDRRTLAIAAGQRPLSDALLMLSCEYETLLGKLLKVYPEEKSEYRNLVEGDILQSGDEFTSTPNNPDWRETYYVGHDVKARHVGHYRRRIIPPADMDTLCRFHAEQCGEEKK